MPAETKPVVTRQELADALAALGLALGDLVIVHTSLRAFGRVEGGPGAVVDAVLDVLGDGGTAVFPTFTGSRRRSMDQPLEECIYTGIVPKTARLRPDFVKSMHPLYSICARGPLARELCEMNDRTIFPAAEHKFLHRMGRLGGKALLMGCGQESNSSIHLIEEFGELDFKVQDRPWWSLTVAEFLAMPPEKQTELRAFHNGANLDYDTVCTFEAMDEPMRRAGLMREGRAGSAELRLMRIADLVRVGLDAVKRDPWFLRKKAPRQT